MNGLYERFYFQGLSGKPKEWLSILKWSVQSTGQTMTISKKPVQCPYPGVCKKLLQALSEAVKDIVCYWDSGDYTRNRTWAHASDLDALFYIKLKNLVSAV